MTDAHTGGRCEEWTRAEADLHRAFGRAFAASQRLESNLVAMVIALGAVDYRDPHSARGHVVALRNMTLGRLTDELRVVAQTKNVLQDSALLPTLDDAVDVRNWLAHGFFTEHLVESTTAEGCRRLAEQLGAIETWLSALADEVVVATRQFPDLSTTNRADELAIVEALVRGRRSDRIEVFVGTGTTLPRRVEIDRIGVVPCGALTATGVRPILLLKDGRPITVGALGLCAYVSGGVSAREFEVQAADGRWQKDAGLPCTLKTDLGVTIPWDYELKLAGGWVLRVQPASTREHVFEWGLSCHA